MKSGKINTALLTLIITAGLLIPGMAAGELLLSVNPDTTTVDEGCEFEISFHAGQEILDLMGYNIVFSFDPEYLEIVSIDEGSLPAESGEETFFHFNSSLSDSTVEINGAVLGATVQTPGDLFRVTFKALEVGKTYVMIKESELRDDYNLEIAHSVEGGLVLITPVIDVEETSWGRLKNDFR